MGRLFSKAKRTHSEHFESSSSAINDAVKLFSQLGRALLDAKETGTDVLDAVATVITWDQIGPGVVLTQECRDKRCY
ncbi:hypothetical protein [Plantibacter sp. RU18]|uniref:hypothetical protein n=1 Tax=Plantibacter sp. RU18 TaxID=3158143 RepID=UPI003D35FA3B